MAVTATGLAAAAVVAGVKLATSPAVRTFASAVASQASELWRVTNVSPVYRKQADALYNAIPAAMKQRGTTVFFGGQPTQQSPGATLSPTPGSEPIVFKK